MSEVKEGEEQMNLKDFKEDDKFLDIPYFIREKMRKKNIKNIEKITKDNPILIGHDDALGDVVGAEYFILNKLFGQQNLKWQLISQILLKHKGKTIDHMKIFVKKTNSEEDVFFDISEFFSK